MIGPTKYAKAGLACHEADAIWGNSSISAGGVRSFPGHVPSQVISLPRYTCQGIFPMFDPREKIALFIDGANLYATSRSLGFDIDYRKLLASFQKRGYLLRAYYYTALVEDQEYSSIRPLIDWLDYNGYKVVTKPAKEFTDATGRRKIKGNMDIELTVDALELADVVDHYVIFSGDGDFRTLVEALQRRGRKVSIVSTMASQPSMISDELRRQADHFIDLMTLKNEVGREQAARRPEPAHSGEDEEDDD